MELRPIVVVKCSLAVELSVSPLAHVSLAICEKENPKSAPEVFAVLSDVRVATLRSYMNSQSLSQVVLECTTIYITVAVEHHTLPLLAPLNELALVTIAVGPRVAAKPMIHIVAELSFVVVPLTVLTCNNNSTTTLLATKEEATLVNFSCIYVHFDSVSVWFHCLLVLLAAVEDTRTQLRELCEH